MPTTKEVLKFIKRHLSTFKYLLTKIFLSKNKQVLRDHLLGANKTNKTTPKKKKQIAKYD